MASAADIIVNLVAKTGKFDSGMRKGRTSMGRFGSAADKAKGLVKGLGVALAGIGIGLVVRRFASMISETIMLNDELGKMATTLGIATETLRGFQLAGELSGVGAAQINKALVRQAKAISDARDGLTTYIRVFDKLGLSTSELLKLDPTEQFLAIAEATDKLTSSTDLVAVAYDLFGGRNVQVINLLATGADAIRENIQLSKDLGAALDGISTARIEATNDQLTLMKEAIRGIKNRITLEVIPVVFVMAQAFVSARKDSEGMASSFGFIGGQIVAFLAPVLVVIGQLSDTFKFLLGLFLQALGILIEPFAELELLLLVIARHIPGIGKQFENVSGVIQGVNERIVKWGASLVESGQDIERFNDGVHRINQAYATGLQQLEIQARIIQAQREDMRRITLELEEQAKLEAARIEQEALLLSAEQRRLSIIQSQQTAREKGAEQIQFLLQEAQDRGALIDEATAEAIQRIIVGFREVQKTVEDVGEASSEVMAQQVAGNMTQIFTNFFENTDSGFKGLLQGFTDMLKSMVAQLLAEQVLRSLFGGFAGGEGFLADLGNSVLGRAHGGPVSGGQPYLVGEQGPELFVPSQSGSIVASGGGGGSVTVINNNDFRGADPSSEARLLAAGRLQAQQTKAEIQDLIRRRRFS